MASQPLKDLHGTESGVGWEDLKDSQCEVSSLHLLPFVHVPFKINLHLNHDYQHFIIVVLSTPSLYFAGEL